MLPARYLCLFATYSCGRWIATSTTAIVASDRNFQLRRHIGEYSFRSRCIVIVCIAKCFGVVPLMKLTRSMSRPRKYIPRCEVEWPMTILVLFSSQENKQWFRSIVRMVIFFSSLKLIRRREEWVLKTIQLKDNSFSFLASQLIVGQFYRNKNC